MKKILFVDDSATIRKIAEMILVPPDYELFLASDQKQASFILSRETIHLILVDAGLLSEGPSAFMKSVLKESSIKIPLLLLFSQFHPLDNEPERMSSIHGVLKKPFETQALLEAVRSLLAGTFLINNSLLPSQKTQEYSKPFSEEDPALLPRTSAAAQGGIPHDTPSMPRLPFLGRAPLPAPVFAALTEMAKKGAAYGAIAELSVDTIAQIAWEVVPELAKLMLSQEIKRNSLNLPSNAKEAKNQAPKNKEDHPLKEESK